MKNSELGTGDARPAILWRRLKLQYFLSRNYADLGPYDNTSLMVDMQDMIFRELMNQVGPPMVESWMQIKYAEYFDEDRNA